VVAAQVTLPALPQVLLVTPPEQQPLAALRLAYP
jgi:hypothetical protein